MSHRKRSISKVRSTEFRIASSHRPGSFPVWCKFEFQKIYISATVPCHYTRDISWQRSYLRITSIQDPSYLRVDKYSRARMQAAEISGERTFLRSRFYSRLIKRCQRVLVKVRLNLACRQCSVFRKSSFAWQCRRRTMPADRKGDI